MSNSGLNNRITVKRLQKDYKTDNVSGNGINMFQHWYGYLGQ